MDLCYSVPARIRDVSVSFGIAVVGGSLLFPLIKDRFDDPGIAHLLAVWVGLSAPVVLVAGLWRWGRRGRLDEAGATLTLSSRGPVPRLAWGEVEEIFRVGARCFELRGAGERLLFSDELAGIHEAWEEVWRLRGASLHEELRAKLDAGATLRFRGPVDPAAGLLRATLLVAFLGPPALAPLGYAWAGRYNADYAWPVWVGASMSFAWVAVILGAMLRVTAWRCGWVEIGPAGLAMRGLGGPRRWAWSELTSVVGWIVRPKKGRPRRIDGGLGNIVFLDSLCRRRISP